MKLKADDFSYRPLKRFKQVPEGKTGLIVSFDRVQPVLLTTQLIPDDGRNIIHHFRNLVDDPNTKINRESLVFHPYQRKDGVELTVDVANEYMEKHDNAVLYASSTVPLSGL